MIHAAAVQHIETLFQLDRAIKGEKGELERLKAEKPKLEQEERDSFKKKEENEAKYEAALERSRKRMEEKIKKAEQEYAGECSKAKDEYEENGSLLDACLLAISSKQRLNEEETVKCEVRAKRLEEEQRAHNGMMVMKSKHDGDQKGMQKALRTVANGYVAMVSGQVEKMCGKGTPDKPALLAPAPAPTTLTSAEALARAGCTTTLDFSMMIVNIRGPGGHEKGHVTKTEAEKIVCFSTEILRNNRAAGVKVTSVILSSLYERHRFSWSLEALTLLETSGLLAEVAPTLEYLRAQQWLNKLVTEDQIMCWKILDGAFKHSPIVTLDCSYNAIGVQVIESISGLLSVPTIVQLNLSDCGFGGDCTEHICSLLLANGNRRIRQLELSGSQNSFNTEGAAPALAKCLQRWPNFGKINLESMRVDVRPLLRSWLTGCTRIDGSRKTCLHELNVSSTKSFGDTGSDLIREVLKSSPHIEVLGVEDVGLNCGALANIFLTLTKENIRLKTLKIGLPDIEDTEDFCDICVPLLIAYIRRVASNTIEELSLPWCELGDEGLKQLLPALIRCKRLRKIDVSNNNLTVGALATLLDHRICSLYQLVMSHEELEESNLDEEHIDSLKKLRSLYPDVVVEEEACDILARAHLKRKRSVANTTTTCSPPLKRRRTTEGSSRSRCV